MSILFFRLFIGCVNRIVPRKKAIEINTISLCSNPLYKNMRSKDMIPASRTIFVWMRIKSMAHYMDFFDDLHRFFRHTISWFMGLLALPEWWNIPSQKRKNKELNASKTSKANWLRQLILMLEKQIKISQFIEHYNY